MRLLIKLQSNQLSTCCISLLKNKKVIEEVGYIVSFVGYSDSRSCLDEWMDAWMGILSLFSWGKIHPNVELVFLCSLKRYLLCADIWDCT